MTQIKDFKCRLFHDKEPEINQDIHIHQFFFLSTALKSKSGGDIRAQMKNRYFKWSSISAIRRNVMRGSFEVSAHV